MLTCPLRMNVGSLAASPLDECRGANMGIRRTLINPYRFHGDKRALNRKLSGKGPIYRTMNSTQQIDDNSAEWNQRSFAGPIVDPRGSSTHTERISCRSPRRRPVTMRGLAYKLRRTLRKVIKEFWH